MLELSLHYESESPVQIGTISKRQNIPKNFLLQLLIRLKNAGIVESTRGVSGGYLLSIPPASISLADVIKAVDSNIMEISDIIYNKKSKLDSQKLILQIWRQISKDVAEKFKNINFEILIKQLRDEQIVYNI